jgi:hypothetical protein
MHHEANRGDAMDIGGWLRGLGLERYEAAFRENKVDGTVLPSLTAEDLKDLGVGLVGDRRKLLDAIAALRTEASATTPRSELPLATDKPAKDGAERRRCFTSGSADGVAKARVDSVTSCTTQRFIAWSGGSDGRN